MGYTTSTIHGIEVPDSSEANNVPEDIGKVVTALEGGSIIRRLTGAAIAALTAPQKPAGLVVYNTTTGKLQISDGTSFADVGAAAWTSYTPTLTASTTNPTNWTQTGYYCQVGKLVVCRFILTAGGSMTAGSGNYRVALPVNANVAAGDVPGPAQVTLYDVSTGARGNPVVSLGTAYIEFRYPSTWPTGPSTAVTHNTPWTWASGDLIICGLMYEAA